MSFGRSPGSPHCLRDDLKYREFGGTAIRHRPIALSSLFEYLCDKNAVIHNPVKGIKRPSFQRALNLLGMLKEIG